MIDCVICQHAKVKAIDTALASGRTIGLIAHQFRVEKLAIVKHCQHAPRVSAALPSVMGDNPLPGEALPSVSEEDIPWSCECYWCKMSGYQRLLKAWEDASTSEKERFCVLTRQVDVPF